MMGQYLSDDGVQLEFQDDQTPLDFSHEMCQHLFDQKPSKILERVFPWPILKTFVVVYGLVIYAMDNAQTILSQGYSLP